MKIKSKWNQNENENQIKMKIKMKIKFYRPIAIKINLKCNTILKYNSEENNKINCFFFKLNEN
jgi:hypothetical protein